MLKHIISNSLEKKFIEDTNAADNQSIIILFKNRPTIDNSGYISKCLSAYNLINKYLDVHWNAIDSLSHESKKSTLLCLS